MIKLVFLIQCVVVAFTFSQVPVAYYPFNGNADDQSGNNNHAVVNTAELIPDRFDLDNSAYFFDGIDDYIEIPDHSALDITGEISISLWVKPGSEYLTDYSTVLIKQHAETHFHPYGKFAIFANNTLNEWQFRADEQTLGFGPLTRNLWQHIVVTFNQSTSTASAYLNGELSTVAFDWEDELAISDFPLKFGINANLQEGYAGQLDDIRIFDHELSLSDVDTLFHEGGWEGYPVVDPPFGGTIFLDPDIITPDDLSTFEGIVYSGQGMRTMYDRRVEDWITVNAFLFQASFNDGLSAEIQVNPEFGTDSLAGIEALKYGWVIGQLPTVLRSDVETVWIHNGLEPFGGGNNNLLIHTDQAAAYEADGILEETFVHEASHTSLDSYHANDPLWLSAQSADPTFISTYAQDHPQREDIAESFLTYIAVRYRVDRISDELANTILQTIPNRIAYFDDQEFNMFPIVEPIDLIEGLLAYYSMNGNADDASGQGNHCTIMGATLDTDRFGVAQSSMLFDGTDDYLEVIQPTEINSQVDYTWNAFVKSNSGGVILAHTNLSYWDLGSHGLIIPDGGMVGFGNLLLDIGWVGYANTSGVTDLLDDEWHMISTTVMYNTNGVYDEVSLYIDGQLAANSTALDLNDVAVGNINSFRIGTANGDYDFPGVPLYFQGNIDDIRIFDYALSQAELDTLYSEGGWPNPVNIQNESLYPTDISLVQNFPNPFNPTTTIRFGLKEDADVSLEIFDVKGNSIKTLEPGYQSEGWHQLQWNGSDDNGIQVATGMYFAQLSAGGHSRVIKMVYLR